jgi:tyrosyl-tRNA synthetase
MTMPLLEGLDGVQKMSQSLGNYIAIRDAPEEMFGKVMSIPDQLVPTYALLATELSPDEVKEVSALALSGGPQAGAVKRRVARAIVGLYHGDDAALRAEKAFDRQFKERAAPDQVPTHPIPPNAIDGDRVYLPRVLAELGLVTSRSEARRLISQEGVKLNGDTVTAEDLPLEEVAGALLQVGKRKFVRLSS